MRAWGELAFEQQPHRVALIAKGWLHADKDIAEMRAEYMDTKLTIALLATGSGAPLCLDLVEIFFAADMVVGADARGDVGVGANCSALPLRIASRRSSTVSGTVDCISLNMQQTLQCRMEQLKNGEMRGCSGRASIGRGN